MLTRSLLASQIGAVPLNSTVDFSLVATCAVSPPLPEAPMTSCIKIQGGILWAVCYASVYRSSLFTTCLLNKT